MATDPDVNALVEGMVTKLTRGWGTVSFIVADHRVVSVRLEQTRKDLDEWTKEARAS